MKACAALLVALTLCGLFKPTASLSVAICVTGQAPRALPAKVLCDNLIDPLRKENWIVDLFLVIANSTERTNTRKVKGSSIYADGGDMSRAFTQTCIAVSGLDDRPQPKIALQVPKRYAMLLDKPYVNKTRRASNHVRQWVMLESCWSLMKEKRAFYDVYIRLREDSMVVLPWTVPLDWLRHPGVYTSDCHTWGGVNDKHAITVGHEDSKNYFNGIMKSVYLGTIFSDTYAKKIHNPETALRSHLHQSAVKIFKKNIPIVKAINTDQGPCSAVAHTGELSYMRPCLTKHQRTFVRYCKKRI